MQTYYVGNNETKVKKPGRCTCFNFIFITLAIQSYDPVTLLYGHTVVRRKTHHCWRYSGETTGSDPFIFSSIFWVVWLYQINQYMHVEVMYKLIDKSKSLAVYDTECMWQRVEDEGLGLAKKDKPQHRKYQQRTSIWWWCKNEMETPLWPLKYQLVQTKCFLSVTARLSNTLNKDESKSSVCPF